MTGSQLAIVSSIAFAFLAAAIVSSDAATVRRHLRCAALPGFTLNTPFGQSGGYPLQVTNQWSLTIPANTVYSVRVGRSSTFSVKRAQALGPGQSFSVQYSSQASQCDVSVPG